MTSTETPERRQYFMTAMREGLQEAMREDPTVVVLGEDVDRGVIGATSKLIREFGPDRIRNTPISEATLVGSCIGAAAVGVRPVVDLMYSSFLYVAMDQLANQAAKLRYMSGGQVSLPIVYFANTGPSGGAAAQHSEAPHPALMNLAGVKVVMPSSPHDAKGLMISAIRDPNPVVYLQDGMLAGVKDVVPDGSYAIPLGSAKVVREGTDVTVVAVGVLVRETLKVAEALEERGVSVEVVDPRTLAPLDLDTVYSSVEKTRRLVVCDNARITCSLASEIAASVSERMFGTLVAAPRRVAMADVPMPFAPELEAAVSVSADRIREAILATVEQGGRP